MLQDQQDHKVLLVPPVELILVQLVHKDLRALLEQLDPLVRKVIKGLRV